VGPEDVNAALDLQRRESGTLGECLIKLGRASRDDIERTLSEPPKAPQTLQDFGLSISSLLNLMSKAIHVRGDATASSLVNLLKLSASALDELLEEAKRRRLLEIRGVAVAGGGASEERYALTAAGVQWARQAMDQNEYVGATPVPLERFCEQIGRQRISEERITLEMVQKVFAELEIPDEFMRELGPAVNSGRSVLLYGPPGNGKTSIGERIGRLFKNVVYVPYCIEVEGQIIRIFDPGLHQPIPPQTTGPSLRREDLDMRWVACWRPFVITGGELSLDMLDLSYEPQAKYYEAPLHIKALSGIFLIDDFGRQLVSPVELLNRWIVPMESRVEYLKLHTGKSFQLPFDELVIFSTNLSPATLMDPAFLRRIPYKIEVDGPSPEGYRRIFHSICAKYGVAADDSVIDEVISELRVTNDFPLASFQPKFIVEQVLAASKFDGLTARLTPEYVSLALRNLYTRDTPGYRVRPDARRAWPESGLSAAA
jgi:hypothetical protein